MFSIWSIPVAVLPSIFVITVLPRSEKSGRAIELGGIGGDNGLLVSPWSRFSGTGVMGDAVVRWFSGILLGRWEYGGVGVIERLRVEQSLGNPALLPYRTAFNTVRARPFSELWEWIKLGIVSLAITNEPSGIYTPLWRMKHHEVRV